MDDIDIRLGSIPDDSTRYQGSSPGGGRRGRKRPKPEGASEPVDSFEESTPLEAADSGEEIEDRYEPSGEDPEPLP